MFVSSYAFSFATDATEPTEELSFPLFLELDLPHTIAIQAPTLTQGASGGTVKTWSNVASNVAASVHPMGARPAPSGQNRDGNAITHKVFLAPVSGLRITDKHRVLFNSRVMQVTSGRNAAEYDELIILECAEVPT